MLDFGQHGGVFKSNLVLTGASGESVTLHLDESGTSLLRSRLGRSFFKTTSKENLLEKVRDASTGGALEKIAEKYYLCDIASLDGVNLYGAKKIFEVVIDVLYKYPMLRSQLTYIGSYEGYESAIDALCRGEGEVLEKFGLKYLLSTEDAMALGRLTKADLSGMGMAEGTVAMAFNVFGLFDAIIIDDLSFRDYGYIKTANDVRYSERSGFHPKGCTDVASVIYHEVGHMLDYTCAVSSSAEFSSYYNSISEAETRRGLSEYALTSPQEFFAEAMAECFSSENPRKISLECLKILDKLYSKRSKI